MTDDLQHDLLERLLSEQGPYPDTLYHYTTGRAFLSIVETQELYATEIRFLNDALEFRHAARLAEEVIEGFADPLREALHHALAVASHFPIYVACMSERSDQLSQWRAYAGNGDGYQLGLSADVLYRARHKEKRAPLIKCRYNEVEQRRILRDALEEIRAQHDASTDERTRRRCQVAFAGYLSVAATAFKHESFRDEEEWRLMWRGTSYPHGRSFRAQGGIIVPMVKLDLSEQNGSSRPLEVESVVIGPGNYREEASLGLAALQDEGSVVKIKTAATSVTPFRTF